VADGSLRPVVDQVLELADAALAHRRVESRRGQGKVVLRVARHELLSVLPPAPACRNWLGVIGLSAAVSGRGLDDPGRQLAAAGPDLDPLGWPAAAVCRR
jgi:Zinc-binding dehydrogenase